MWSKNLENYIIFSSTTDIPFSYDELMNMPLFMIEEIYVLCEKEFDRKTKQQLKQSQGR